jgi:hypothetical protein
MILRPLPASIGRKTCSVNPREACPARSLEEGIHDNLNVEPVG